jgi:hypothetical protein
MGFGLFTYFAVLLYAAAFAWFIWTIADSSRVFCIVLRDNRLGARLSGIGSNVVMCVLIGLCAAYVIRLQAEYLRTDYQNITHLLFHDLAWLLGRESWSTIVRPERINSSWTSAVLILYTLSMFFSFAYFLQDAFQHSRRFYAEHVKKPTWRDAVGINGSAAEIDIISNQSFLTSVFPRWPHLAIVFVCALLSWLLVGVGMLVIGSVIYAIITLVVTPSIRNSDSARTSS